MKTLAIFALAFFIFSCSKGGVSHAHNPLGPAVDGASDLSGILSVTIRRPAASPLAKPADMSHGRLQIIVSRMNDVTDTSFPLSSSSTLSKLVRNVPVSKNVRITANIFSRDDSLTHTGVAFTDVLAGETTHVEVNTQSRFGYLSLLIYDVPSNVDSGYVRISGSGMADVYSPLFIDSLARDSSVEYDGHASAFIEYIPIGTNRRIQVFLLKSDGLVAYDGSVTADIRPDSNRIGTIVLDPSSAKLKVGVVAPDYDTSIVVGSVLSKEKPETGRLVISEVMYNPDGTDNNEWIELYNPTAAPVDLSLYRLIVLHDTFSLSGTVPAGGFFVAGESDSSYIDMKTGPMNIPNSGDSAFIIIDDIANPDSVSDFLHLRYGAAAGWPVSTDGVSIALNRSYLDARSNNYGVFWAKSTEAIPGTAQDKGTPGY